jgi:hypothetical protein
MHRGPKSEKRPDEVIFRREEGPRRLGREKQT